MGDGIADDTAAIQQALNQLGRNQNSSVLYLPAGTYRIRRSLVMTSHINVSVLGNHRDTTKIKWDGSPGGTLLALNGVRYSKFGRISWDGNGKAGVGIDQSWDGQTPNFDTANEYISCTFQDLGYGIQAGNLGHGAAESVVWNCHFLRNSLAGIITKNFNALDWYIWYCLFRDCAVGITNDPGAGNFHVTNSVFLNSTQADIEMRNTMYFSIRNNFSRNSKAFFVAKGIGQNGAPTTIQNNRIIDPIDDAAIRIENLGPVLLLDNRIKSRSQTVNPVVVHQTFTAVDFVAVGNQFTVNNSMDVKRMSEKSGFMPIA